MAMSCKNSAGPIRLARARARVNAARSVKEGYVVMVAEPKA
jgi:hypothetical protein